MPGVQIEVVPVRTNIPSSGEPRGMEAHCWAVF